MSTLASSNGSATPSKIRSSTSGRVSYSESPTSTPIQRTDGSAARNASTDSPRPQPRSTTVAPGRAASRAGMKYSASACADERVGIAGRSRARRSAPGRRRSDITHNPTNVHDFYEAFWSDAPADPEPWEWERRRALLLDEARPGERVLDLGCGAGRFLTALQAAGADPVGVEIAEAAAERARAATGVEVRLVEPDGTLPFGHGEFDLVWCSEVLEHVPDALALLQETRRVLKRGGRLLLTVPYHGRFQAAAIALTRFDAALRPARPARALLHPPLARHHARARGLRGCPRVARAGAAVASRSGAPRLAARRRRCRSCSAACADRGSTRSGTRAARPSGRRARRAAAVRAGARSPGWPARGRSPGRARCLACALRPRGLLDRGEVEERVGRERVAVVGDPGDRGRSDAAGPCRGDRARRSARGRSGPAAARSRPRSG